MNEHLHNRECGKKNAAEKTKKKKKERTDSAEAKMDGHNEM